MLARVEYIVFPLTMVVRYQSTVIPVKEKLLRETDRQIAARFHDICDLIDLLQEKMIHHRASLHGSF